MVVGEGLAPPVKDLTPPVTQNKTKNTGRQGADPYKYAEKDNKPVGDGALDILQNKAKNTAHQDSEAKPRVLEND